jgi:16S rRNA (uracil1498-N3)-methyltransferase
MPKHPRPRRRQTEQSNTYRFFVDADALHGREAVIEDAELAHQLGAVLRLRPGERVLLLDNSGWQYVVALDTLVGDRITGTVERKELAGGEPRTKLTLYVALLRPERFEWVLQKGTELGVSAFVPVICERSTIADADELSERKLDRWRRIVREAAEQSRRGKLPRLAPALFFPAACEQAARRGQALLLWEGAGAPPLRKVLRDAAREQGDTQTQRYEARDGSHGSQSRATRGKRQESRTIASSISGPQSPVAASPGLPFSVALFSGPEGGFSAGEFETASRYGIISVTLGPRTLRAETAPLVAASAILYEMGDLD